MTEHTKDRLAAELAKAGLPDMSALAGIGYYDDFLSPLDTPCLALVQDLMRAGTPAALMLRKRAMDGEFDATKAEADAWAKSEDGQEAFHHIARKGAPK